MWPTTNGSPRVGVLLRTDLPTNDEEFAGSLVDHATR
jgi:hypothetical protein